MASAESLVIPLGLPGNINDWDEDQATTFLTANQHVYRLKDDEIKAIKEQGLDGGDLLDLEVEHLQRCGIRAGPAMRIVRHISKLKVEGSLSLVTSEQKLTEKRFLSRVPPAINYIENGKSKGTTKPARGLIPQSVDHWPTFKNKAGGLGFDDSIQLYNKPVFSEALVASKEAEVDSAFNINILVNLKTIIGQGLRFHGQEPMPGGTPDHLITTEDDDNDILLFIEIKSKWVIDCDDIVQKYHNDLHITREGKSPYMSIIDPIKQVFGYMGHGKLQYGVMSTYDRTWFLRRPKDNPGCLQISECVKYTDTDPTLLQCLAYMITLPRNGNNYSPTPPPSSPPPPPPQNDSESSEGDDHVLDSSYRPRSSGRGGNRGQGGNRSQGEKRRGFDAKGEGSGSTTNQVHMPEQFDWDDFDTTNVLGHGRCGMVFEATFRGEKVALKLGDIWQHPELEEEMLTEMKTYMALEQLQGHTIPKFKGAGYTAGGLFAIATEMMGSPIKVEDLSYSERCKIVDALSKIHHHGFIHNDIRPENILIQRHRDGFKVTFIDFAFSKRASKKEEPRKEMATLKTMLGLRKFKKPRPA